ncbi:hypothetical protein PGT21_000203 [Puccinia graminis f. sp. tritici]|uniref:Uncharacterized protein n=1 Tax=Puccinia graminis f. sp. tritici TaxID=56615 RepID=A0A5B0Q112_PUCGR|nr:hypothetical protein PGT21_000203 [Puccinia graminis f. sp. tritici]
MKTNRQPNPTRGGVHPNLFVEHDRQRLLFKVLFVPSSTGRSFNGLPKTAQYTGDAA